MEQRVFLVLEQHGYYVETNPVYADSVTGKSREYDFSAVSAKKLFRGDQDFVFAHLIGECMNNSQPLVFFRAESPIEFLFCEEINPTSAFSGSRSSSTNDLQGRLVTKSHARQARAVAGG